MHFLVPTIQISTQWRRIVLFSGNGVSSREVKSESLEALKKCTTSYGGFYFSRLRSVLLPCQSWGPAGPRYSGWIWNESGHFIVFGREKLWDLVLLEKNSKPSGELEPWHKLLAVSSILILGGGRKLQPPGCVLLSCAVWCRGCLLCSMCSVLISESRWSVGNSTRLNIVLCLIIGIDPHEGRGGIFMFLFQPDLWDRDEHFNDWMMNN